MNASPPATDSALLLLETKLFIPRWRADMVARPRLVERMQRGNERKLTLISAPAGFGKSTLLAEWAATAGSSQRIGWISLDQHDNQPARFWTYALAALQKLHPGIGTRTQSVLQSPQPAPIEALVTTLLNEISAVQDETTLILDDYHVIETQTIHAALALLIDHLPPQFHLIIASRSEPPIPLARLRSHRELTELRSTDLRFTPDETTAFLRNTMALTLPTAAVAALEQRTEGWIAGLQLAALSMQGRADAKELVAAFSGDDRYILDYLVQEVLHRQPARVRRFLLHTSILSRLHGPLCDAVTGDHDGRQMLETLERSNLFVIALDDKRQWYRYHHLFAQALHAIAQADQPDQAAVLHRRAANWYQQHGLWTDAVSHALATNDGAYAASLVELAWPPMRRIRQEATILGWMRALPEQCISTNPGLSVGYAWALLDNGELDPAAQRLRAAERLLSARMSDEPETAPTNEAWRSLPASIANARAYHAQARGDIPGTVGYAQQALELLPAGEHYERGTTASLLGLAYWSSGELDAAYDSFASGLRHFRDGGSLLIVIGGTSILALINKTRGRLRDAMRLCEQALELAAPPDQPALPGAAELHLDLSDLYRERGDLARARQELARGEALREHASLPGNEYRWCLAQARMHLLDNDVDNALVQLDRADRLYDRSPIPDVHPIAAFRARVWTMAGRLADAQRWVRERGLSVDDELGYLREYEHITLVRVRLAHAQHDTDGLHQTSRLLERLLEAAERGARTGSVIELLILQARAHHLAANNAAALLSLERALTLAEPEAYVRLFVDEGPPMAALLEMAADRRMIPAYVRHLRASFGAATPTPPITSQLPEPLSDREQAVLRLLATDLSGPAIASELIVSLNTLRTHTRNIYAKLGVNSRRTAIRRAQELGLLR